MAVFWVATRGLLIALMMEAARASEALVKFYQITRRYNPEDSHLCVDNVCYFNNNNLWKSAW
jgi:hypothetical protein